jgi:hypothetical protein
MIRGRNVRMIGLSTLLNPGRDLGTAGDVEPRPDALRVRRHRCWRDTEPTRDGVVLQALFDEHCDLTLARRQA